MHAPANVAQNLAKFGPGARDRSRPRDRRANVIPAARAALTPPPPPHYASAVADARDDARDDAPLDALLAELADQPADLDVRRRVAEALDDAGHRAEALDAVAPLINLTGHDDVELPCLCKRCLPAAPATAEAAGMAFVPSLAVVGTRVLHFWILAEQARKRRDVRSSVAAALRKRLARGRA